MRLRQVGILRLVWWAAVLGVASSASPSFAQEPSAETIALRALEEGVLSGANTTAEVTLSVFKDKKPVRERRLLTKIRRNAGRTQALLEFLAPAEVAGTRFLSLETEDGPEQYVYLPAFKKVKRVVGAQRTSSFMGTDFTYADLEGRNPRDFVWVRLPDASIGGHASWVIEGRPRRSEGQDYGRWVIWVHRECAVPMKTELFAPDGTSLLKRLTVRRLEKKGERWLATEAVMTTLDKGTETRLTLSSMDFTTPIPEAALTRAALER